MMHPRKRVRSNSRPHYAILEPRQMLATMAEAGIAQRTIDLVNNQGDFVGQFEGYEGTDNSNPVNPLTDVVLNDVAFQHTVDGVATTEVVPGNAQLLTTKTQLLNSISAGTVSSPNVYHVLGDFSLNANEEISLPSNVMVYVEGSIFKAGTFTSESPFGSPEAENSNDFVFRIQNSDNVSVIGINNALVSGTPTLDPNDPHSTGFRIEGNATNVVVDGFEIRHLWQGVDVRIGSSEVIVQNNYIHDIIKRAIWFLGTSNSTATHNFIVNPGVDGVDFDAYTANSVAYENVVIGAGRFAFFVEEGANNNFSVRQLAIMYRFAGQSPTAGDYSESSNPLGFQLGNTSNGTGDTFYNANLANDPTLFTRDNFFLDNLTLKPVGQNFRVGGDYVATADNLKAGNSYFFGNRGYGAGPGAENAPFGRNLSFKAYYSDKLPNLEFVAATNGGFGPGGDVSSDGFHSYDMVQVMNDLDSLHNSTATPIRAEILPDLARPVVFEEVGGKVVIEAEHFSERFAGTGPADGRFFNLLIDDSVGGTQPDNEAASGDQGIVAEINPELNGNVGVNTGDDLNGPRVDYEIYFQTPGDYRLFVRTLATSAADNSFHVGFDGTAITTGSGMGLAASSNNTWTWVDDVEGGIADVTINVSTTGLHTLNLWMREDGVQIDKIVLDTAAAVPTGFGPTESAIVSSQLLGRSLAYNNSIFDGNDPSANSGDDAAIATNKSALLPGETATFENYSSYLMGINAIVLDAIALVDPASLTADDFVFRTGNGSENSDFVESAASPDVSIRLGEGVGGSDRITLTFGDEEIVKTWLQVTLLANERTGLENQDVFYFGNAIGETGNNPANAIVNLIDVALTRGNQTGFGTTGKDSLYDFNRDSRVNLVDVALARANQSGFSPLNLIVAPDGNAGDEAQRISAKQDKDAGEDNPSQSRGLREIESKGQGTVNLRLATVLPEVGGESSPTGSNRLPNAEERKISGPEMFSRNHVFESLELIGVGSGLEFDSDAVPVEQQLPIEREKRQSKLMEFGQPLLGTSTERTQNL